MVIKQGIKRFKLRIWICVLGNISAFMPSEPLIMYSDDEKAFLKQAAFPIQPLAVIQEQKRFDMERQDQESMNWGWIMGLLGCVLLCFWGGYHDRTK